jgi:hypothetical protein
MYSEKCKKERARNLEFLSNTPDIKTVVLASLWQAYYLTRTIDGSPVKDRKLAFKEATEETVNTIRKPGRKIILVSNFPKFPFDPMGCVFAESGLLRAPCSIEKLFPRRDLHVEESPIVEEVFAQVANKMPDVEFVSPGDGLCRFDNCLNSINGEFLYRDPAHIRRNLSETTLRKLSETIGLHQVFSTEQ